jgi:hypothetical protein
LRRTPVDRTSSSPSPRPRYSGLAPGYIDRPPTPAPAGCGPCSQTRDASGSELLEQIPIRLSHILLRRRSWRILAA